MDKIKAFWLRWLDAAKLSPSLFIATGIAGVVVGAVIF